MTSGTVICLHNHDPGHDRHQCQKTFVHVVPFFSIHIKPISNIQGGSRVSAAVIAVTSICWYFRARGEVVICGI